MRRLTSGFRATAWAVAILFLAQRLFHVLRGSPAFKATLEDDFFYYSITAGRFVETGRITFDNIHLTNGFHPFWFAIIAALRAVCGSFGTAFWTAFSLLLAACVIATFEWSASFLRELGAPAWLAAGCAAAFSVGNATVAATGMEVALATPLVFRLLLAGARDRWSKPAKLGLLASLTILARIDLGLLVVLLLGALAYLERPPLRALLKFCAAGILLPIYALANLHWFHAVLPVSALVKQQATRHVPHIYYLYSAAFRSHYGVTAGPLCAAGFVAVLLDLRRRLIALVPLLFAAIFFALNSLTGWIFFGWYAFAFGISLPVALFVLCTKLPDRAVAAGLSAIALGALGFAARDFVRHGPLGKTSDNGILQMSLDLREQLHGRVGVFAMGAMAGLAAETTGQPFVQLEGLVGDRAMLEHIKRQDSLQRVLRESGVDYLVESWANEAPPRRDGCYDVSEPHAMWASDARRLHGAICAEPVIRFVTPRGENSWSFLEPLETLVFDVRDVTWSSR
jgi:hypothetical protein